MLLHSLVLLALLVSPCTGVQAGSGDDSAPDELQVITPENVENLQLLAHAGSGVLSGRYDVQKNGDLLAAASTGGVLLFNIFSGEQEGFIDLGVEAMDVAFSPDGKRLALVYNVPTGEFVKNIVTGIPYKEFQPRIEVYDLDDLRQPSETIDPPQECAASNIWKIAFSQSGKELVYERKYSVVDREKAFCKVSLADGSIARRLEMGEDTSVSDISINGAYFAYIPLDDDGKMRRVKIYRSVDFELLHELSFDAVDWAEVKFSSTGDAAAVIYGANMQIWSLPQGKPILLLQKDELPVSAGSTEEQIQIMSFDVSSDGSQAVFGTQYGNLLLWDLKENHLEEIIDKITWEDHYLSGESGLVNTRTSYIEQARFSPDGESIIAIEFRAVVGQNGQIHVYRRSDGEKISSFYGSLVGNEYIDIDFSPDGEQLAWGGYTDGHVEIHNSNDGSLVKRLDGHRQMVNQVKFSQDGSLLATGGDDGTVRLWNTKQFKTEHILTGHQNRITQLAFSPDGAWLASGSDDQTIRLWNTSDGNLKKALELEDGEWRVDFLSFLPDNQSVLYRLQCYPSPLIGYLQRQALWQVESDEQISIGNESIYIFDVTQDGAMFTGYGYDHGKVVGYLQADGAMTGILDHIRSPYGNGALTQLTLSADRQLLVSGNGFGLHAWEISGTNLNFIGLVAADQLMATYAKRYQFSPDGKMLAFATGGMVYVLAVPGA